MSEIAQRIDGDLREKLAAELGRGEADYHGEENRILSADAPGKLIERIDEIASLAGLSRSAVIKALLFVALRRYAPLKN
jgi:hypothetical protein